MVRGALCGWKGLDQPGRRHHPHISQNTAGKGMSRIEIREDRCKGCLLCTTVCPTHILVQSGRINALGYKVVQVEEDKADQCKGCAFCAEICPDCVITVFRPVEESKSEQGVAHVG